MRVTAGSGRLGAKSGLIFNPKLFLRKWGVILLIGAPWPVMISLYIFGPISYRQLSASTICYLVTAFVVLATGYHVGWKLGAKQISPGKPNRGLAGRALWPITLISLLGSSLLLLDSLRSGFSFWLVIHDPIEGRVLQSEHVLSGLTTVSFPFAVISFSSFLFGIMRLARGRVGPLTIISILSVVPFLLTNVLQSGRQTFLIVGFLMVSWLAIYWAVNGSRKARRLILRAFPALAPLAALVLAYFFFIATNRNSFSLPSLSRWAALFPISLKDWASVLQEHLGTSASISLVSGIFYYTHQLSGLDSIVTADIGPGGWGRLMGTWLLSELSRTGLNLTYSDMSIQNALTRTGEFKFGWLTGFSVPIGDFGVLGSIPFMGMVGLVLGSTVRRAIVTPSDVNMCIAAWLVTACLFAIEMFPGDGLFTINLVFAFVLQQIVVARTVDRAAAQPGDDSRKATALGLKPADSGATDGI